MCSDEGEYTYPYGYGTCDVETSGLFIYYTSPHCMSRTVYTSDLHEIVNSVLIDVFWVRAVQVVANPKLTVDVKTCGPHTAILLQHHAVRIACSHGLHAA